MKKKIKFYVKCIYLETLQVNLLSAEFLAFTSGLFRINLGLYVDYTFVPPSLCQHHHGLLCGGQGTKGWMRLNPIPTKKKNIDIF